MHSKISKPLPIILTVLIIAGASSIAIGIAFYFLVNSNTILPHPAGSSRGEEFKSLEEHNSDVKLFLDKYGDHNSTKGFGRFPNNNTIKFTYVAAAYVDKNGDGIKETNRRLDLTVLYDESGEGSDRLISNSYDPARVKQIEIRCREQTRLTPDIDKAFTDVVPPAYDGHVKDFIENVKCLSS